MCACVYVWVCMSVHVGFPGHPDVLVSSEPYATALLLHPMLQPCPCTWETPHATALSLHLGNTPCYSPAPAPRKHPIPQPCPCTLCCNPGPAPYAAALILHPMPQPCPCTCATALPLPSALQFACGRCRALKDGTQLLRYASIKQGPQHPGR